MSIRDFEYAAWQRAAPDYDATFAGATRPFIPILLDAAGVRRGTALLDICCGPGYGAGEAAQRGAHATGLDFSPEMIAQAQRRRPDVAFQQGDAERLLFPDGSFDAVIANFGIHHIERPLAAIGEIHRVLAPGGHFAFTLWVAARDNPAWRLVSRAIAACGNPDVPMPAGDSARTGVEHYAALTVEAGFGESAAVETVEQVWRLPLGADLVAAFESGTARMATMIRGQEADALPRIRAHVARALAEYAADGIVAIPTRAYMITARKVGGEVTP